MMTGEMTALFAAFGDRQAMPWSYPATACSFVVCLAINPASAQPFLPFCCSSL